MGEFSQSITGHERASFEKTLCCMLKDLEGHNTTVELRNEIQITGYVDHVDGHMNISMSNAIYEKPTKPPAKFSHIKIHGKQIRFIHIPDQINMQKAITKQLDKNRHDNRKYGTKKREGYIEKKRVERQKILENLKKS